MTLSSKRGGSAASDEQEILPGILMSRLRTFDHYKTPLGTDGTPYAHYEMLRDEAVEQNRFIHWSEAYGGFWVVVGWQESADILANQADFSSSATTFPQYSTPSGKPFMLSGYDEPDHSKYRRIVQAPFTRPRTLRMLQQMRELSNMLLDNVSGQTHFDVCKVTDKLPGYAFCFIMGLSMESEHLYRRFAYAMVEGATNPEAAAPTIREMGEYWLKLIANRRKKPGDGLIDALISADCGGRPLTDEELLEFCTVLLLGGFDNTLRFLANALYRLARNEDLRRALAGDPERIPSAIDEFLRLDAPACIFRLVRNTVRVGDVTMKAGDIAGLIYPICNRDPRQFRDPDKFIIGRSPNRHLTFGQGIHHCLGAFLAHAEGVALIEQFLKRFPDFDLDSDRPARWGIGQVSGMQQVPVVVRSH